MHKIKILSAEKIQGPAREFIKIMNKRKVVAFYGELGSGKTTFIKAVCKELGVIDMVSSPTFAIVYEYKTMDEKKIYHLDLYRVSQVSELFDLGYEDYLYGGSLCFIEWPEKAESLLPEDCLKVFISIEKDGSRILKMK